MEEERIETLEVLVNSKRGREGWRKGRKKRRMERREGREGGKEWKGKTILETNKSTSIKK